ncbi:MAG: SulP family inorganic anion transporter [Methylobacter sp.]
MYGPTAAFIPVIAALINKYGEASGGTLAEAHGFLVFVSIIAGIILMMMGVFGLGKYARLVPNSIIVGFTVGIAVAIALSNFESVLGVESYADLLGEDEEIKGGLLHNLAAAYGNIDKINFWSVALGLGTFIFTKLLLRISIFIPEPLLAIAASTLLSATMWADKGIILVKDIYGSIPNSFFVFTPPVLPTMTTNVAIDILYFVFAIVFVSAVESVLCSSMADRMANNRGTPFNPDKEFWGQGLVQIFTPLVNGFACTGALARTATSIKAGAVTPLAGYFKAFFKLSLAYYIAQYLEMVPMACIGGILLWVASNMIKASEIKEVVNHNRFHALLMAYTTIMVPMTDFLTSVLSALVIYFLARRFFDKPAEGIRSSSALAPTELPGFVLTRPCFEKATIPLNTGGNDDNLLHYAANLAKLGLIKNLNIVYLDTDRFIPSAQPRADVEKQLQSKIKSVFGDIVSPSKVSWRMIKAEHRLDAIVRLVYETHSDLVLLAQHCNQNNWHCLSQRLAMISRCSVWMIPDHFSGDIQKIVVPIDFSLSSGDCLEQAAAIASAADLPECLAVHVYLDEAVIRYEEHQEIIRGQEEAKFAKFMSRINTGDIVVKPTFIEGNNPAQAILKEVEACHADLVVISTRGHSKAATLLLGSTTSQLMVEANIPVLVVKHFGKQLGLSESLMAGKFWERIEVRAN